MINTFTCCVSWSRVWTQSAAGLRSGWSGHVALFTVGSTVGSTVPVKCSKLSRISSNCFSRKCVKSCGVSDSAPVKEIWRALPIAVTNCSAKVSLGIISKSETNQTPSRKAGSSVSPTLSANLVLPTPPTPVSVNQAQSACCNLAQMLPISKERPKKGVSWRGRLCGGKREKECGGEGVTGGATRFAG